MPSLGNLEDLNTSELVEIALNANLDAHRLLPREVLYAIIRGEQVALPERTINKKRLQIMQYIDENWLAVEALVGGCPAHTRSPTACFRCPDLQVAFCTQENRSKFADDEGD